MMYVWHSIRAIGVEPEVGSYKWLKDALINRAWGDQGPWSTAIEPWEIERIELQLNEIESMGERDIQHAVNLYSRFWNEFGMHEGLGSMPKVSEAKRAYVQRLYEAVANAYAIVLKWDICWSAYAEAAGYDQWSIVGTTRCRVCRELKWPDALHTESEPMKTAVTTQEALPHEVTSLVKALNILRNHGRHIRGCHRISTTCNQCQAEIEDRLQAWENTERNLNANSQERDATDIIAQEVLLTGRIPGLEQYKL